MYFVYAFGNATATSNHIADPAVLCEGHPDAFAQEDKLK
jgi:hypothetical protein